MSGADKRNSNRLDIYFHADSDNGGQKDDVLPVLCEFIGQVYPKLDWIIKQNEEILAGGGGDTGAQAKIDGLTKTVEELTQKLSNSETTLKGEMEKEN